MDARSARVNVYNKPPHGNIAYQIQHYLIYSNSFTTFCGKPNLISVCSSRQQWSKRTPACCRQCNCKFDCEVSSDIDNRFRLPQFKKIHKDQQPDESGLSLVHHVALIDSSFESGLPSSYPAPLTYIYNVETRWSPRPAVNQFKVIPSTATSELYDNMDAAVNIPIPVIPFTGDMSNFIGEVYVPGMDMPPWANHVPGHLTEHNTMPQGYPHPVPLMPPNLIPLPPQLIPLPYSVQQHLAGVQRLPPQPPHVIPQMQQPQEIETHNQLGQFIIMPPMPDNNNPPLGQLNQIFPQFPPQFQPPQRTFGHGQMSFPVNQTLQPPPPTSPPPPWTPTPQFISQGPAYLPRQIIMSNLAQPRLHYPKMAAQLGNPGQPTIMYNQYSSMTSQQASPYPTIGLSSYIHINLQNLEELVASQREFINILSQFGETPLLLLCKSSLTESVKLTNARLLLAVGADVNIAVRNVRCHVTRVKINSFDRTIEAGLLCTPHFTVLRRDWRSCCSNTVPTSTRKTTSASHP